MGNHEIFCDPARLYDDRGKAVMAKNDNGKTAWTDMIKY